MITRLKYLLLLLLAGSALLLPAGSAGAQSKILPVCDPSSPNYNANLRNSPLCKPASDSGQNPIVRLINTVASIVAVVTGLAAVVMIIIGGLTFITSAGNPEKVANSRRRIIYAVVGLIVVALASVVTVFITNKVLQ